MKKIVVFIFLLAVIFTFEIKAKFNEAELDDLIGEQFKYSGVNGLAVTVVSQEGMVFSQGYGGDVGAQNLPDSPLFIGSVSKVITSLGVNLLIEQELIKVEDRIDQHLTNVPQKLKNLTIKDLLHHHSGISQQSGYDKRLEYDGDLAVIEQVAATGEKAIYSSANSIILGMLIEAVSDQPYAEFVQERIFKPLKMHNSYVPTPAEGVTSRGNTFFFGLAVNSAQMDYGSFVVPAGYVVSTTNDMAKFSQMFINNGTISDEETVSTFIEEDTVKAIFSTHDGSQYGFGQGWGIGRIRGEKVYNHSGMTKISNAKIVILPERKMAIIAIANTNSGPFFSVTSEVIDHVIGFIKQQPLPTVLPKEILIRLLFGVLLMKTMIQTIKAYFRWKSLGFPKNSVNFDFKSISILLVNLIPFVVMLVIPKMAGVTLSMFLRIMPDLGFALLLGGVFSLFHAVFILLCYKATKN